MHDELKSLLPMKLTNTVPESKIVMSLERWKRKEGHQAVSSCCSERTTGFSLLWIKSKSVSSLFVNFLNCRGAEGP